jgi:hypothetical protein
LYAINLPELEPRLQRRFEELTRQHLATTGDLAAGLRALSESKGSFAAVQAAWRFYRNPRVTLPKLMKPLLSHARSAIATACDRYVLTAHDWSALGYGPHASKTDRIRLNSKKPAGYELAAGVFLSDRAGEVLAPAYHELSAAQGVLSTRSERRLTPRAHLDALTLNLQHVAQMDLGKTVVHIVDAEADSVGHLRRWDAKKWQFVTRGDDVRWVKWQGTECRVADLLPPLEMRFARAVEYKGRAAQQYVSETAVTLHKPSREHRMVNGRHVHRTRKGKPLDLRLVVSEIRDATGERLARWLLWTNVSRAVDAETIALWYYWRWTIESYFKLLKRAGHHVEQWQQTCASAIARRLLVAATACVVVWSLARSAAPQASEARQLLVRLSGRLMKRGVDFTEPALLAGMWVLLAMLDTLEEYTPAQLRRLAAQFLPLPPTAESG